MDLTAISSPVARSRQARAESYAPAAALATDTKAYQRLVDTSLAAVQSVTYVNALPSDTVAALGRPQLAAPAASVRQAKEDAQDRYTWLMSSLLQVLGDNSLAALNTRMSIFKSVAKSSADGKDTLSKEYQASSAELAKAVAESAECHDLLSASNESLLKAQAAVNSAQKTLDETALDASGRPSAEAALKSTKDKLQSAQGLRDSAAAAFCAAANSASLAGTKAEALAVQLEKMPVEAPGLDSMKSQLNAAATMILLMTTFAELMGKAAENKLDGEQALFRTMQATRQEFIKKKAAEYQLEVEKSQAAAKTMGCIGDIVGKVLLAVSILALPFTGGASLALAAVGIALVAGDMVYKEVTGTSLMEKAMSPLMAPLTKLIEAIGKDITAKLELLGVDKAKAQTIGMIAGAVMGAILMVATLAVVMVIGKSIPPGIMSSMGKMIGKLFSRMLPDLIKQAGSTVSKGVASMLAKIVTKLGAQNAEIISNGFVAAAVVTEVSGEITRAGFAIKAGVHQRDSAEAEAALVVMMNISAAWQLAMEGWIQDFTQMTENVQGFIKKAFDIQSNSLANNLNIARNI